MKCQDCNDWAEICKRLDERYDEEVAARKTEWDIAANLLFETRADLNRIIFDMLDRLSELGVVEDIRGEGGTVRWNWCKGHKPVRENKQ